MDHGIIHYRRRIVRLCIKALDENEPLPKITILQAMKNLVSSWNSVSEETIANCFKKAKISKENQVTAVTDADDPFKGLKDELNNLQKLDQSAVQNNQSAESFIGLDSKVVTSALYMSDSHILIKVISDSIEDQDDDVIEGLNFSPPLARPSKSDVEEALDKLQGLSLFSSYGNEIRHLTLKIEIFLNKERTESLKQSHLPSFL